jgi:hypothetical protein
MLQRMEIVSGKSRSELLLLGLTEEGRYELQQIYERVKAQWPYLNQQRTDLTSPENRARQQRSDRHLVNRANPEQREQEAKEAQAKTLLRAGKTLYEISKATGLDQKRLMELSRERHQEDRAATWQAEQEQGRRLAQQEQQLSPEARDLRSIRQSVALSDDPMFGSEEEEDAPGGLHTLGNPWGYHN